MFCRLVNQKKTIMKWSKAKRMATIKRNEAENQKAKSLKRMRNLKQRYLIFNTPKTFLIIQML